MSKLPNGEWTGEPDLLEFEAYGFKCEAKRHDSMGHLCGYITVGAGHPWYALDYDRIGARVHGGLTYSQVGSTSSKHGFDCAHAGDLVPKMCELKGGHYSDETYKGMGFVVGELISLARQAKEAVK
jgi:hypothetical protein